MALGNFSKQPRCRYRDACDLRQKYGRFFHLLILSQGEKYNTFFSGDFHALVYQYVDFEDY